MAQQQRRPRDGSAAARRVTQATRTSAHATDGAAAQAILNELTDVLREASARGVDLVASFAHFDRRHEGLVGVDEFMAAVVELRVGSSGARLWDESDAERCIERISSGKSRVYFARTDFVQFFSTRVRDRASSASSDTRNENRHSQQTCASNRAKTKTLASASASKAKKQKLIATKRSNNSRSTSPIRDYLDEFHLQHQRASLRDRESASKTQTKRPLVSLPTWAHDRSKRALQELENLQQRKRRLPPSSLSERSLYATSDVDDETHVTDASDSANPLEAAEQLPTGVSKLKLPETTTSSDVLEFPVESLQWRTFDLDTGTTISYSILSHESALAMADDDEDSDAPEAPNASPTLKPPLSMLAAQASASAEGDASAPNLTAFRFTVFLDALQRFETLEAFFRPLLLQFPRGKVLLCGFPTRTPRRTVWNNDAFAQAYAKLLVHLMHTTREWLVQPKLGIGAVPQFVIGFGSGGAAALRLLATEIPLRMQSQPLLELFLRAQRGLVLINALARTTESARHSLQQIKRVLSASAYNSRVEMHESLVQSVFSDFYLTQVAPSRRVATEMFFRTRKRFLEGSSLELVRLLLHGSVKSKDVTQSLSNLSALEHPFAIVVIHGSLNALFGPDQVEMLTSTFGSDSVAPTLTACLALDGDAAHAPMVHVSWLKSGHEVLQERPAFMHNLFRQLASVDVVLPVGQASESDGGDLVLSSHPQPSLSPSPGSSQQRSPQHSRQTVRTRSVEQTSNDSNAPAPGDQAEPSAPAPTDFAAQVQALLAQRGIKWIQQELYDRGLEGSGATTAILKRYEQVLADEHAHDQAAKTRAARQRAKLEALEAERRAKQRDELERQIRENEAQQRIQQREHEAQKAFFAQMEEQKQLQARMALEHDLIALEDAFSQRCEALWRQEHAREECNRAMTHQVEELDAERLEQEREAYQVALQRERLAAQHAKREALKAFQRAFEQNELVSSPVEAYALDLAPKYDNFEALAAGAVVLATDLVHFYELKATQRNESIEKRAELEERKTVAAAKELALRNLERVLVKAKTTGMIAKAGLGTVRIVPITALEFQALTRELDEKQSDVASIQHDLTLRTQELAWKDTLLQRLSELIKRNEGFRREVLQKLTLCAERGNELVLNAREDGEQLYEQRERNTALAKRCAVRLASVQDERSRAAIAMTEYFDTRLRVEGTTQRVLRTVLVRELDAEIHVLEAKLEETRALEARIKTEMHQNKAALSEFGAQTFRVEQSLQTLEQAIASKDRQTSDASVARSSTSSDASGLDAQGVPCLRLELAEDVRRKPHATRSAEEKRWVALDFQLQYAHYYKCVDPYEVEIIQKHGDYQVQRHNGQDASSASANDVRTLQKEQIERLLTLPARTSLALAFVKTPAELEAHSLLRKYSFGDGEEYFAHLDDAFVLDTLQSSAIVTTKLEELPDAVDTASTRGRRAGWFVDKGSYALLNESAPPLTLLSASQCQLEPHRSVTHTFKLPTLGVGVLSLAVSIVFQGHFRSVGYQNGRLAGMLYVLPPPLALCSNEAERQAAVRAPVPVGKCFYERDVALCTPHSLGKLVIRHDPRVKPLSAAATYQVVLGAPVLTAYSLEVTAHTALLASEVLKRKRSDALKKQELLPLKRDEVQNVFVTIELSERKKRLARKMANDAKDAARVAELTMIRKTKAIEEDNVASVLSHEARAQLHSEVHAAESTFTHQCFLFAKREEEARDIESALKELTRIHADLLEQCDGMERDLVEYRAHLPHLAASLIESRDVRDRDAAGAKVARELNVEYESVGVKSGKVLWAELSAMKAKLPSMMTPAERLRRKYKRGHEALEKKEREWILLDRILHPRLYDWEARLVVTGDVRMRLHGAHPKLSKDEEQLAVLSHMEVDRIMKAPWNLLERKEIQIRKIVTKFRDDKSGSGATKRSSLQPPTTSMVALLRSQKTAELTTEEREWRLYDQLLNPSYYPVNMKKLADELRAAVATPGAALLPDVTISPHLTREDLVAALSTPEEELFKLPSELLRARTLLLKYDPQLSVNLVEAARIQHSQSAQVEVVETDVDARCRLVYQELQRAIANTRNEFMDSFVLHSTLQRFPTKVLRLELEKELDRLLMSQVTEKEEFELRTFLANAKGDVTRTRQALALGATAQRSKAKGGADDSDSVSDSDSDEEAKIAREAKAQRQAKLNAKAGKSAKVCGKALKQKSVQRQRREIKDVRWAGWRD